jgi:hypothetical protein
MASAAVIAAERIAVAGEAIRRLPEAQRVTLTMAAAGGMSSAELVDALGVAAGTVRYRLSLARRAVAETLDGYDRQPLTIVLMVLVAIASVQLIAPGLGRDWFGNDFRPQGWTHAERFTFLWTELLPVLFFVVVGVLFWWRGRRTREWAAKLAADVESPAS